MKAIESGRQSVPLGRTVITANALRELNPEDVQKALHRHASCDWGECCAEDASENDLAMKEGSRILSVYRDRNKIRFWIISEADRSITTVLLPEDY